MDDFITLFPVLLSILVSFLAKSSVFLGFFNIKKADLEVFCNDISAKAKELRKTIISCLIDKARKDVEVPDIWFSEIVEKSCRAKKLEKLLTFFIFYKRFYFKTIMNFVIFSVILALVLLAMVMFKNEYIAIIVSAFITKLLMYIYAVCVTLYIILGGRFLSKKRDELRDFNDEIISFNSNINLQ